MNIILFREYIKTIDNVEQKISLFKNNIINQIANLKEEEKCEEAEYQTYYMDWSDEEREEFEDKWNYISSNIILKLFNEMGWEYHEVSDKKSVTFSVLSDCAYIPYTFSDVWGKIKECDNVEFCYAMIVLANNINVDTYFLRSIKNSTSYALKKYGLSELKNILVEENLPTVFVAMSFSKEMNYARAKIEEAIKIAGYEPIVIDEKKYNGFIVPEIFYEIEKSKFIVADFTGHKKGVYYETGYAKALKKEVIMTCKEKGFSKAHFDTKYLNHILWKDENDLYIRLIDHIKSTVGFNEKT